MAYYTIYNNQTGVIVQSGSHPDPLNIELGENESIDLTGAYSDVEWKYENNSRVEFVPTKTIQQLEIEILMATQQRLDDFARTRNYDNILSACTYATSTVPQFQAEGQRAVDLRDLTWASLYQLLGEVQNGTRPIPTSYSDIESELPALSWE